MLIYSDKCLATNFVISNIFTALLPPNTAFKLASAFIILLFFLSCSPFFLIYAQSFLTTSDRGMGPFPTIAASSSETFKGFIKAEFVFFAIFLETSNMKHETRVSSFKITCFLLCLPRARFNNNSLYYDNSTYFFKGKEQPPRLVGQMLELKKWRLPFR